MNDAIWFIVGAVSSVTVMLAIVGVESLDKVQHKCPDCGKVHREDKRQ